METEMFAETMKELQQKTRCKPENDAMQ